ncbi:MAG: rod shape-determining protein MreC [Puniceicoccaceae bacterium]|nr:MAG: rod shape-determining protein MreC [Puniceicoccaceae bacterium]
MDKRTLSQARPFLVLGLVLLAWLLLPTAVRTLLRVSFSEFHAPAVVTASHLRDLQAFWGTRLHSKRDLIEAGRDLARLNAHYELGIQELETIRLERDRLEALLDLPSVPGYRYEIARVARRDFTSWWQQVLIRKGSRHGLEEGMGVIFSGGVVGVVREVHTYTAVVDLLSSPRVRMAVFVEGDDRPVSFRGGANPALGPAFGRADFVPADISASPDRPRLVVTSGLGGIFPAGLAVGLIEQLEPGPDGLFRTGRVALDPRLNRLAEVAVLVPLEDGSGPAP